MASRYERYQLMREATLERQRKYYDHIKQQEEQQKEHQKEEQQSITPTVNQPVCDIHTYADSSEWLQSDDGDWSIPEPNQDIIDDDVDYVEIPYGLTIDYPGCMLPQFLLPAELTEEMKHDIYKKIMDSSNPLRPEDIAFFKLSLNSVEDIDQESIYELPDEELLKLVAKYEYESSLPEIWAMFDLSILKCMDKDQKFKVNDNIYYLKDNQWAEVTKRLNYNYVNVSDTRKQIVTSDLYYQKALFIDRYFSEFRQQN